jgi:hypothetical protein
MASPTPSSSPTPAAAPSIATPRPESSETPALDVDLPSASQSVRVRVNGLAVRREPSPTAPLVAAYRFHGDQESQVSDEVRLSDGYFLWIEDGPLVIKGVPWYRVANSQRQTDDPHGENVLVWDADGDEFRSDHGWVAGGDGVSVYLVPDDAPSHPSDAPVHGPAPEPFAILSGIGGGGSEPFQRGSTPVGIRWYAADPEGARCQLTITLEPVGIGMASVRIDGWDGGDDFWPKDFETATPDEVWIDVETDCSWSLRAVPIQG